MIGEEIGDCAALRQSGYRACRDAGTEASTGFVVQRKAEIGDSVPFRVLEKRLEIGGLEIGNYII